MLNFGVHVYVQTSQVCDIFLQCVRDSFETRGDSFEEQCDVSIWQGFEGICVCVCACVCACVSLKR